MTFRSGFLFTSPKLDSSWWAGVGDVVDSAWSVFLTIYVGAEHMLDKCHICHRSLHFSSFCALCTWSSWWPHVTVGCELEGSLLLPQTPLCLCVSVFAHCEPNWGVLWDQGSQQHWNLYMWAHVLYEIQLYPLELQLLLQHQALRRVSRGWHISCHWAWGVQTWIGLPCSLPDAHWALCHLHSVTPVLWNCSLSFWLLSFTAIQSQLLHHHPK